MRRRIGFNYRNRGKFLTDKINIEGFNDKHVIEYYLEIGFAKVCDAMIERYGAKVMLLGAVNEVGICEDIRKAGVSR